MNAVVYLFQVSACMGIFYLFYYLLLSRYTFFTINRWYLIITLAISFIIPLLTITVQQQDTYPQVIQQVVYINQMQTPQQVVVTDEAPTQVQINWMGLVKMIYTIAVAALLIRLLLMVLKFFTRVKNKQRTTIGGVHIVQGDEQISNGSFFNFIFLNGDELSAEELNQIIAHEMLHVKLFHSVDRMLVKMAQVFLWFNPFVYLYAKAIEENHEFEVDRSVSNSTDRNKYAELLFHLSVARQGTLYHNFSMVPLKKRITMLFTKPTNRIKKVIYLLVVPVILISCLAFAKLKNEGSAKTEKRATPVVADSAATVKYRQKSKLTPAQRSVQDEGFKKMQAYFESPEGKEKMALAESVQGKLITVTVLKDYTNKAGKITGKWVKEKAKGEEFIMLTGYGQSKQLNKELKKGDKIDINVFYAAAGMNEPLTITPAYLIKNGKKIFQLAEAGKIPDYAFLCEANKVRFADGQISNVTKYPNGKWKTAVFERINGYKFNLSFKPNAPDLRKIEEGDHVRLRFIHEVKTGDKTYNINDWVAISTDIKDYGIKNPEWFYKFYEVVKADTGKVSAIGGIDGLGTKPLVLINGKEYDKDILYKISMRGVKGTSTYGPNKGDTKYGDKAKDGAVIIDTRDGEINYLTANERENIIKANAAKENFFSRTTLTKDDGSKYDLATISRKSGAVITADVSTNGKIAFIIDDKVYGEKDFKRLFPVDKASYGGGGGVYMGTKELAARGFKLDGYEIVFVFETGAGLKPINAPVKMGAIAPGNGYNKIETLKPTLAVSSGFEVKSDGTLWVNNQPIKRAMINGKEYMGGGASRVVNTLPAEMIEKIKVTNTPKILTDGKEFIPNNTEMKKDLLNSTRTLKSDYKKLNDSLVTARFPGKVVTVKEIFNTHLIIIKNGDYFAAYSNLKNVSVSSGQEIRAGQVLGVAAALNRDENSVAAHFELYRGVTHISNKAEQEVIIRDLGQQRLNMRLKLGEVYAFKL